MPAPVRTPPPIPGVSEGLDDGPMGPIAKRTAQQLVRDAIKSLRKAAALDPRSSGKIGMALSALGAASPTESGDERDGEPLRPGRLTTATQTY